MKTSAAWLIEHAGFARGHGDPATIAISSKHTLALTNRGAGTTGSSSRSRARSPAACTSASASSSSPEPVFAGHAWRS